MESSADTKDNKFANCLRKLLKTTHKKVDWAAELNVTQATLSQWVTGMTTPKPEHIQKIVSEIEEKNPTSADTILSEFYQLIDLEISEIMPDTAAKKLKGASTISEYLTRNDIELLDNHFLRLPSQVTNAAISLCSRLLGEIKRYCINNPQSESYKFIKHTIKSIDEKEIDQLLKKAIERRNILDSPIAISLGGLDDNFNRHHSKSVDYILNCSDEVPTQESSKKYRFAILILNFYDAEKIKEINAFDVDEFLFLKVQGKFKWEFVHDSKAEVNLTDNDMFSMHSSAVNSESANYFPKSKIRIEEPGYGLAFLYRESGLSFDYVHSAKYNGLIELKSILDSNPVKRVPLDKLKFANIYGQLSILKEKLNNNDEVRNDPHSYKRNHSIAKDAFLHNLFPETWESDDNRTFSVKLIRYTDYVNEFQITKLATHFGTEIVIPITGKLGILFANPKIAETINTSIDLEKIGLDILNLQVNSSYNEPNCIPNFAILNSELPHSLTSYAPETICLHIRILRLPKEATLNEKSKIIQGIQRISASDVTRLQ